MKKHIENIRLGTFLVALIPAVWSGCFMIRQICTSDEICDICSKVDMLSTNTMQNINKLYCISLFG